MGTHDKKSRTQRAAATARNLRYIARSHFDKKIREDTRDGANAIEALLDMVHELRDKLEAVSGRCETVRAALAESNIQRDAAIAALKEDAQCDHCAHFETLHKCNEDICCEECAKECPCKDCTDGSCWEFGWEAPTT